MDRDLRASLVAALCAAAVSALVGLIYRVGFGALVLRALLGGAFFGALVFGAVALARSFLPGLEKGAAATRPGTAASAGLGQSVDIVLPGEEASGPSSEAEFEALRRSAASERGETSTPSEASLVVDAPGTAASSIESSGGEIEGSRGYEVKIADRVSLIGEEGPGSKYAELGTILAPALPGGGGSGFEDLDVLPDLDGFSDAFSAAEYSEGGGAEAAVRPKTAGSVSASPENLDPAALAKAVRTILKRDQKG